MQALDDLWTDTSAASCDHGGHSGELVCGGPASSAGSQSMAQDSHQALEDAIPIRGVIAGDT
jgi:hypothetical protein